MEKLAYAVMVLTWSTTWRAIHLSHQAFSPAWGAAWRFLLAAVLMLPWMRLRDRQVGWRVPLIVGVLGYALNYTATYGAVALVPSGTAAVMFSSSPLFTAVWAHRLIPGERLTARAAAGLAMSVAGIAVLQGALELPARDVWTALGLVVLGTQTQALSTVLPRRLGRGLDPVTLTARAMAVGAAGLVLIALLRDGTPPPPWSAPPESLAALGYLAAAGTCMTFTLFYWLVHRTGPLLPSTAAVVCPVLALFFGAAVGGEPLGMRHLAGAALSAGGVLLALLRRT